MPEMMTLIGGRTSKQGTSLTHSKLDGEYVEVTSTVEMNVEDMARLGLKNGSRVKLRTPEGEAVLKCKGRETKDLPRGILFLAYGPLSSQLMAGDTAGTGMPISKNLDVEVEPVPDQAGP
jgi:formylmethanofuran dehydrogenase subunit D